MILDYLFPLSMRVDGDTISGNYTKYGFGMGLIRNILSEIFLQFKAVVYFFVKLWQIQVGIVMAIFAVGALLFALCKVIFTTLTRSLQGASAHFSALSTAYSDLSQEVQNAEGPQNALANFMQGGFIEYLNYAFPIQELWNNLSLLISAFFALFTIEITIYTLKKLSILLPTQQ